MASQPIGTVIDRLVSPPPAPVKLQAEPIQTIAYSEMLIPPEARDKLLIWKQKGKPVFYLVSPGTTNPLVKKKCTGCNDTGVLGLQFVVTGPHNDFPNNQPENTQLINKDGKWYTVESLWYSCPKCSGRVTITNRLLTNSGLLENELHFELDYIKGYDGKTLAYQIGTEIQGRIPKPVGLYLFYGSFGVGKSGILMSLVAAMVKKGYKAKYLRYGDYLDMVRGGEGQYNQAPIVRKELSHYQLLAIDEVGKGRGSDTAWAMGEIFQLMDDRYRVEQTLCTLVATNDDPDSLWPYFQSRFLKAEKINVSGIDLRGGN